MSMPGRALNHRRSEVRRVEVIRDRTGAWRGPVEFSDSEHSRTSRAGRQPRRSVRRLSRQRGGSRAEDHPSARCPSRNRDHTTRSSGSSAADKVHHNKDTAAIRWLPRHGFPRRPLDGNGRGWGGAVPRPPRCRPAECAFPRHHMPDTPLSDGGRTPGNTATRSRRAADHPTRRPRATCSSGAGRAEVPKT